MPRGSSGAWSTSTIACPRCWSVSPRSASSTPSHSTARYVPPTPNASSPRSSTSSDRRAESCGILGRVYKDRWETARSHGHHTLASALLTKAIDSYVRGFEADWRDHYPGINAVELMWVRDPTDEQINRLLPVVRYSAERAAASGVPTYWEYATLLEIAVLERNHAEAEKWLGAALAATPTPMEIDTTLQSLTRIRKATKHPRAQTIWLNDIEHQLTQATTRK